MKTIKELEKGKKFAIERGQLIALKDVLKLIDERLNNMIASNIIEDELLYLKARIEGGSELK